MTGALRAHAAIGAGLGAWLLALSAQAHPIGLSRGEYRATPGGLDVVLVFAASELRQLLAEPKANGSVFDRIQVRVEGELCTWQPTRHVELEADGVELRARYTCPESAAPRTVALDQLFAALPHGHRHQAWVPTTETPELLLFRTNDVLRVPPLSQQEDERRTTFRSELLGFVRMGVEHILTGYDHVAFLLGLLVVSLGLRRTLVVASAFTVAHSITLAVSLLGFWSPPSRLIEPLIALSVVYVGARNLRARFPNDGPRVAFAFGLIHGFGFAGALETAQLPHATLVWALGAFNLGVELGQFAIIALALPALTWVATRTQRAAQVTSLVSAGVLSMGLFWFVTRL